MTDLKPCPFCGEKATIGFDFRWHYVYCINCHAEIKSSGKAESLEAWNKRAENEELEFTRKFIHEHGLEFALASDWGRSKKDGNT